MSPIDGRYHNKTQKLTRYFSEYALMQYRTRVEVEYFIALCQHPELPLPQLNDAQIEQLRHTYIHFSETDALQIKQTERITNHDVKAVEYFVKKQVTAVGLAEYAEWVHFGLTSQDINHTATPMLTGDFLMSEYLPTLQRIVYQLFILAKHWQDVPMLSRTHGQPASPTLLGKELLVFVERIERQILAAQALMPLYGKFGGAVGNFNAHYAAFPNINWRVFAEQFLEQHLGLRRYRYTTQIEHYDQLAALLDLAKRINTILIDLCRDMWTYISMDYFKQQIVSGEVGSSTMPHKVNPIDFENAEGNLGIANALYEHLSAKLPISRLQRDLTDSTVLRNLGVPFAHTHIAFDSLRRGLDKISLNQNALQHDLNTHWEVVTEAIQTILRREGYEQPYEALKNLSRSNEQLSPETLHVFIQNLSVSDSVKIELKNLSPFNYTGNPYL